MTALRVRLPARPARFRELAEVRVRLAEAEEALRAIRSGEVDTLMGAGKRGGQVFSLDGAEHAYRLLIESMNEGALTLTGDKVILFANRCFATMVRLPLKDVIGSSFRRFLSNEDRAALRSHLKRVGQSGSKIQVTLLAGDGSKMPVQISIRPTAGRREKDTNFGVVVTDLTEALVTEARLRVLMHRVVQVQEEERGRVALELHDGITQHLCAIVFRCQALVARMSGHDALAMGEAKTLRDLAGETVEEVVRVAHNLRPNVLDRLGLVAGLREAGTEFGDRTDVSVEMALAQLAVGLSAENELTLYRILQESLRNVEKHAGAKNVTIDLTQDGAFVQLIVRDDGVGFDPLKRPGRTTGRGGLGLFGMRERAGYAGGTLDFKSAHGSGSEIKVRIPITPADEMPAGAAVR
jgi:two-component system, NarL family, sensor kinase